LREVFDRKAHIKKVVCYLVVGTAHQPSGNVQIEIDSVCAKGRGRGGGLLDCRLLTCAGYESNSERLWAVVSETKERRVLLMICNRHCKG
jgi:hypothetical protein